MKFTTPCFVRVDNEEKREMLLQWLRDIGYYVCQCASFDGWSTIHCSTIERNGIIQSEAHGIPDNDSESGYNVGMFQYENDSKKQPAIDCEDNIELFKALAAMNDENDREQWFTDTADDFDVCSSDRWSDEWQKENFEKYYCYWRKATAEEIVEHFKNRKR